MRGPSEVQTRIVSSSSSLLTDRDRNGLPEDCLIKWVVGMDPCGIDLQHGSLFMQLFWIVRTWMNLTRVRSMSRGTEAEKRFVISPSTTAT